MIKLLLNTTGLLLLACLSTVSLAASPAEEDADEILTNEPLSLTTEQDERPATMDEEIGDTSPPLQTGSYQKTETIQQQGDVLAVPQGTAAQTEVRAEVRAEVQAVPVRFLDFPRRGMTTSKVENELGRPVEIIPPIGQPPISRWVYDDRVVYFEYSSVIHVVATR